ncbi:hypothetical protein BKA70DRAFT_519826 [Coprinopsis sp. MPI-PUGE-AT-0042]|nr:hypothetical protein BKA70DRAFT_519826 [Coprinopsis sp. MPI-PUGE-AT-0042]
MEAQGQVATGSTGVAAQVGATRTPPAPQNLQGVQVYGAPLNVAARDVHNHVNHYYAGETPRYPPGWDDIENHRRIQIATLGRTTRGTGLWVRQMGSWCIWLDPKGHLKIMWGYGMPGAGKTLLASIVIDILDDHARSSTSPICVNYIYFRYSDHSKANVRWFLEILVKQTVERHDHCLPLFDEIYARHIREKTQPSVEELLSLYQRLSKTMLVTFCILDALDEAPPEIQIDILEKLASVNVKLFITSRPSLNTVEARFPNAHCFRIVAHDEDIDLHIQKEISRHADLREMLDDGGQELQGYIAASIKDKCRGMFLHASLQLDALRDCTNVYEVKSSLATFSTKIEDLYLETWNRITSQTPSKILLAQKVLLWVITATRSLTVDELRHALAVSPDTHRFDQNRLVKEGIIIGLCRGLVTVEEETRLVRLVHYTAKDPLERLIKETFSHPNALPAAVSMALLTESGFQRTSFEDSEQLDQALDARPLLGYAYNSWFIHARQSLADPVTANLLVEFIRNCHGFPVQYRSLYEWNLAFDLLGPLHVVAFFNFPFGYGGAHNLRNPSRGSAKQEETALHLACMQGHDDVVKELLQLPDTLVNAVGITCTTALMWASALGKEGATRLLLGHPDVNVNAVDNDGCTALIWASRHGHKDVVALLLSHPGINTNMADRFDSTALSWALRKGHEGTAALLLAQPDGAKSKYSTFHLPSLLLSSRFP